MENTAWGKAIEKAATLLQHPLKNVPILYNNPASSSSSSTMMGVVFGDVEDSGLLSVLIGEKLLKSGPSANLLALSRFDMIGFEDGFSVRKRPIQYYRQREDTKFPQNGKERFEE